MEEQKLGNYNGIRNGENVVERKKDGILETPIGFSTVEMSSLTALCNAFFPSLPLEASGLVLDSSEFSMDVEEFYRASLPNGWSTFEVDEKGHNPFCKAIKYYGPDPVATTAQLSPKPLESSVIDTSALFGGELDSTLKSHGCKLAGPSDITTVANVQYSSKDHAIECNAFIIGSGYGSGVAATVLAKAGFKVVVLEKGGYKARHDLELLEGVSMRELYEGQGFITTKDQNMLIMAGSIVGGGFAVN